MNNLHQCRCPTNWIDLGPQGCFLFADFDTKIFDDAQKYCNNLYSNAYLAEIKDEETQLILTGLAEGYPEVFAWWLGGSDFYEVSSFG